MKIQLTDSVFVFTEILKEVLTIKEYEVCRND